MSETTPHPTKRTAGASVAPAGDGPDQGLDGGAGRWAVMVSALGVVLTAAACLVFFTGFLGIARLPGPIPPMDAIPRTGETAGPLRRMGIGLGLFGAAALFCLTGLVAGIRFWNRVETYRSGAWAIALAACAPVLTVMMLAGMGAT